MIIEDGDNKMVMHESLPIIEYFEEVYPHLPNKLLPADPFKRWQVRCICEKINCIAQPLGNIGVLQEVEARFGKEARMPWGKHFDAKSMHGIEAMVVQTRGKFCVGDEITLADVFLLPQLYRVARFELDVKEWPATNEIAERLADYDFVKKAHCDAQIDAVL